MANSSSSEVNFFRLSLNIHTWKYKNHPRGGFAVSVEVEIENTDMYFSSTFRNGSRCLKMGTSRTGLIASRPGGYKN